MFGINKKKGGRRERARQLRAGSTESLWTVFTRQVGLWPVGIALSCYVLALFIGMWGERSLPYSENQKIGQPILARVDFSVSDPQKTIANRQAARESTPNYYDINTELIDRVVADLTQMFEAAQAESFDKFKQLAGNAAWANDELAYQTLHSAADEQKQQFTANLERLREALRSERTARPTLEDRNPSSTAGNVVVMTQEGKEVTAPTLELIQIGNKAAVEGRAADLARKVFSAPLQAAARNVLNRALTEQPMLQYNDARTREAMTQAEDNTPLAVTYYERGKPFVFPRYKELPDGSKQEVGLSSADLELLRAEADHFQEFLSGDTPEAVKQRQQLLYQRIGMALAMGVLMALLFAYTGLYHPRILQVHSRTLAFVGLVLGTLLAARFVDTRLSYGEITILPVLLAASILTLAYPRRFAAGVTAVMVLVVGLMTWADLGLFITLFACGYVAAHLLNDIRTRTKIVTSGLSVAALAFFLVFSFGLAGGQQPEFIVVRAGIATGSAVLAALIIQAALPFIERGFKVATSLTLLEWRDANKPLLKRLAQEAPGTYNHSLVLATMAESACDAIGANGLLAHVGSMYHDIGKVAKAEYFAENQEASINRHDRLSPTMSLLIILGHVKDGVELAKEYGLPRVLHPFITEHHGTTLVRYFHHVASEKKSQSAVGKHDREVAEAEFRYPGPKPQSKETAVLMLCDGVEGAVRALPEPTAGRIETTVHTIVQARLKDGQFDECDITLRELHLVEQSLVKSLCRFYHGRVAYPKDQTSKTDTQERRQEPPAQAGA